MPDSRTPYYRHTISGVPDAALLLAIIACAGSASAWAAILRIRHTAQILAAEGDTAGTAVPRVVPGDPGYTPTPRGPGQAG